MHIRNTTIFVAMAAIYGFVLGFGYGNLFEAKYGFELKEWQTLAGVLVAVGAAILAYIGVRGTQRINVVIKEQDRLTESLPGLREVSELMLIVRSPLRSLRTEHLYQAKILIDSVLNMKPTDSIEAAVHRRLPLADHHLRKEVLDILFLVYRQAALLVVGKDEVDSYRKDIAQIHTFAEDARAGLREVAQRVEASHKRESDEMRRLIASLDTYADTVKERILQAEQRLSTIRGAIDKFFKED